MVVRGSLLPRVLFANARPWPRRRDSFRLARRQHADAPAINPTFFRTMDGFRFSAELFIVFRSCTFSKRSFERDSTVEHAGQRPFANTLCA